MESKIRKVIIVGAGASGLQAASTLKSSNKYHVEILEASSLIGGRVRELQDGISKFPVQLGACYIHGHKSINYQYAKKLGVKVIDMNDTKTLIHHKGEVHDIEKFLEKDSPLKDIHTLWFDTSLSQIKIEGDPSLKEYAEKSPIGKSIKCGSHDFIYRGLANQWGADWSKISAKGMIDMHKELEDFVLNEKDPGDFDNYLIVPPFSQSEILKKTFEHLFSEVKLDTRVTEINYDSKEITIKDHLGESYTADAVIVTIPLAVLKKGTVNFVPALPQKKAEAIEKLNMTPGGKVFVKFKKNLWGDVWRFLNDGFIMLYTATGCLHEPEKNTVIEGFVMGQEAEIFGKAPKEKQKELLKQDLQAFFGADAFEENYEDHYYFGWETQPDIGGAYSFPAVSDAAECRRALRETIDKKVYFAGEATDCDGYSQTVSGALSSGKRAAEELMKDFE